MEVNCTDPSPSVRLPLSFINLPCLLGDTRTSSGEKLKAVWAQFSTLSSAVFLITK